MELDALADIAAVFALPVTDPAMPETIIGQ